MMRNEGVMRNQGMARNGLLWFTLCAFPVNDSNQPKQVIQKDMVLTTLVQHSYSTWTTPTRPCGAPSIPSAHLEPTMPVRHDIETICRQYHHSSVKGTGQYCGTIWALSATAHICTH